MDCARFTFHNMATNVQAECEIKDTELFPDYNDEWHTCKDNVTQFQFSLLTTSFNIRQSWVCDDSPK